MRKVLLFIWLGSLLVTACSQAEQSGTNTGDFQEQSGLPTPSWEKIPEQLPQSMKGYELYSWQDGSTRVYTLVTGTNRAKSFDEITATENTDDGDYLKITVTNLEDLKKLLARLPVGEEVFWGGINLEGEVSAGTVYFSYPPEEELQEVVQFSMQHGINLHTYAPQQEGEE